MIRFNSTDVEKLISPYVEQIIEIMEDCAVRQTLLRTELMYNSNIGINKCVPSHVPVGGVTVTLLLRAIIKPVKVN